MAADDERYLVVDGRRWRRSDPRIPERLRAELVAELMAARRAVRAALRTGDDVATAVARARVHAAKTALGERGRPWWEAPDPTALEKRVEATVDALLAHRPDGSVCPSEPARIVGGDGWRNLLPTVRTVAEAAARAGSLTIRQRGHDVPVDALADLRGPYRIARP